MKNSFGTNLQITVFGESHGPCIGIVLDGLPAGFSIDEKQIEHDMELRKPKGKTGTQRHEEDTIHIVSGFFNGYTTGSPLTILIENKAQRSKDYAPLKYRLRPSHADWSAFEKYHGYQDYRGGGHFSGRLTAPIVAAGSICKQILNQKGVKIATHLEAHYTFEDDAFSTKAEELDQQIDLLNEKQFPTLNEKKGEEMKTAIEQAALEKDSVGGILESAITHFPAGIGEPFFDSLESLLAHALFSIPAVKGVSFGLGFDFAAKKGSEANDALYAHDGRIETTSNNNAGINGGISNGMPILIHTVIKPTASIFKAQKSVEYDTKENIELTIEGRHDPCIAHRARIVVDSMIAFTLLDAWMSKAAKEEFEEETL